LLGIRKKPEILKLYNEHISKKDMEEVLSKYSSTGIGEFIAEAWAEYKNNPEPRPVAQKVAQIILDEYGKFKKGVAK
jgi:hypothetical protein